MGRRAPWTQSPVPISPAEPAGPGARLLGLVDNGLIPLSTTPGHSPARTVRMDCSEGPSWEMAGPPGAPGLLSIGALSPGQGQSGRGLPWEVEAGLAHGHNRQEQDVSVHGSQEFGLGYPHVLVGEGGHEEDRGKLDREHCLARSEDSSKRWRDKDWCAPYQGDQQGAPWPEGPGCPSNCEQSRGFVGFVGAPYPQVALC